MTICLTEWNDCFSGREAIYRLKQTEDEVRMSTIRCPSCSAPSDDDGGKKYNICNHCRTLYLFDGTGSYVPSYAEAKLKESEAIRRIHEWASDVKGGREFSRNIELARMSLKHLPLYIYGKDRTGNDTEVVVSVVVAVEVTVTGRTVEA